MTRPSLSLRIIPRYPARVQGTDGIGVVRTGGAVTIKQDWSNINTDIFPPTPADFEMLLREIAAGAFRRVSLSTLVTTLSNFASQAEAEAGVINDKGMTPLRTKQAVDAQRPATAAGLAMLASLTAATQTALLSNFTGDSGSGGLKGLVPAPTAGDSASNYVLRASGTFGPIVLPTGAVLQTLSKDYTANADLSTTIPLDDTVPLISEGTEVCSQAITLADAANKVLLSFGCFASSAASQGVSAAIFRGSTCVGASVISLNATTGQLVISGVLDAPASVGPHTYSVRIGPQTSAVRLNGGTSSRFFGGAAKATLTLHEIKG